MWRPQCFLILIALSLQFLTSSLTYHTYACTLKQLPFSSNCFLVKISFSTTVGIDNLPVYKLNLHIISWFVVVVVQKEAFSLLMKRVCWNASDLHFLSRTEITICKRHKRIRYFAVYHDRGAAPYALFWVVLSQVDAQHSQWSNENKAEEMSNFLW